MTTTATKFDGATPEAVQALNDLQQPGIINDSELPGLIIRSYTDGRRIPRCYRLTFAIGTSLYKDTDPVDLEITFRRDGSPVGEGRWLWKKMYPATEVIVELLRALVRTNHKSNPVRAALVDLVRAIDSASFSSSYVSALKLIDDARDKARAALAGEEKSSDQDSRDDPFALEDDCDADD